MLLIKNKTISNETRPITTLKFILLDDLDEFSEKYNEENGSNDCSTYCHVFGDSLVTSIKTIRKFSSQKLSIK